MSALDWYALASGITLALGVLWLASWLADCQFPKDEDDELPPEELQFIQSCEDVINRRFVDSVRAFIRNRK